MPADDGDRRAVILTEAEPGDDVVRHVCGTGDQEARGHEAAVVGQVSFLGRPNQ